MRFPSSYTYLISYLPLSARDGRGDKRAFDRLRPNGRGTNCGGRGERRGKVEICGMVWHGVAFPLLLLSLRGLRQAQGERERDSPQRARRMDSCPVSWYGVTFFRGNDGVVSGTGNHKGCPYDGLAGGYFQRDCSCRLLLAPRNMKVGAGRFANRPYGRMAGAWIPDYAGMTGWYRGRATTRVAPTMGWPWVFSEGSFMSAAADTTKHESGSKAIRESPLREVGWGMDSRLRGNDGGLCALSAHTKSEQLLFGGNLRRSG